MTVGNGPGCDSQVETKLNDGLRNLRPDAADDAVGAHQAGSGNSPHEMLGNERINRRHAGRRESRCHAPLAPIARR